MHKNVNDFSDRMMNQFVSSSANRQFSFSLYLYLFWPFCPIASLRLFYLFKQIIMNFETKCLLCDFNLFRWARIQKCMWWLDNSFPMNKYTSALILICSLYPTEWLVSLCCERMKHEHLTDGMKSIFEKSNFHFRTSLN